MTFYQAFKQELRNEFGSQWTSSAVQYGMIAAGLLVVGLIGFETIELASNMIVLP